MTYLYFIERHDDTLISSHERRGEASWNKWRYHDSNDYEIVPVNPLATLFETPRQNRNGVYPA